MLGRKRTLSNQAAGCPPQGGTPQSRYPTPQGSTAPPTGSNVSSCSTSAIDLTSLIDGMRRMTLGTPENGVEPKRVCLPGSSGSSQAGGCPAWRAKPQSRSPLPWKTKTRLRRRKPRQRRRRRGRKRNTNPHATTGTDIMSLISGMQNMAVGPLVNGTAPKRVCLPGSSPSSRVDGCPPWRRTREIRIVRLGPPGSLRKAKEQRRKRNIPPRTMRAIAQAHINNVVQRAAVGGQGNSMGPRHVYLMRPSCNNPPKDDVEPMEVDPPDYGVGTLAVQPAQDTEEPMEVD